VKITDEISEGADKKRFFSCVPPVQMERGWGEREREREREEEEKEERERKRLVNILKYVTKEDTFYGARQLNIKNLNLKKIKIMINE
jgi:hypothetical protein